MATISLLDEPVTGNDPGGALVGGVGVPPPPGVYV
jgi:hypothetical protein